MPKFYGPFHLYHRVDSRTWEADRIESFIDHPGIDPEAVRERKFIKIYPVDWEGYRRPWLYPHEVGNWLIRDSSGLIVPVWYLIEQLQQNGFYKNRYGNWRRIGSIPYPWYRLITGGKRRRWRFRRYPANISQKRTREASEAHMREYDLRPPKRKYIPNNRDDIPRGSAYDRNWKRFRKTQYRVKSEGIP